MRFQHVGPLTKLMQAKMKSVLCWRVYKQRNYAACRWM